ncbi:MAG: ankyrin repeat domain-containing protein [Planctomycetota bacterium]
MSTGRNLTIGAGLILFVGASLAIGFSQRRTTWLPPHRAAFHNDVAAVTYHLRRGFDVNTLDPAGRSLLELSLGDDARESRFVLVKALVDAGIDLKKPCGTSTYLVCAARVPRIRILRLLSMAGADPNQRDQDGYTPLMRLGDGMADATAMAARHLLDAGADPTLASPDGYTALRHAKVLDNDLLIKILRKRGARR